MLGYACLYATPLLRHYFIAPSFSLFPLRLHAFITSFSSFTFFATGDAIG